ncbi:thioredoxin domain-containing protein [Photobacterium minamisatsumaniensis]|uniref:thioredoxin domain-containing protein n=1 Tax=Photobacterium minamisatsumaniensis TaxID=2910233 RepID=UPI003D095D9D
MTFSRTTPLILFFAVMILLARHSYASSVQEGVHYNTLPTPIHTGSDSSRIVKYFSLSCPPCKQMSKFLPPLEDSTGTRVDKKHVVFNTSTRQAAYLYYSAKEQTSSPVNLSFMAELFDAVQTENTDAERLTTLYKSYGLQAPGKLNNTQMQSVSNQIEQIESIMKVSSISAIPAFVVDGKYLINLEGHGGLQGLVNTMNYLLTLSEPTI